eukprot:SAG31_NODE_9696_length_1232_cov_1.719544_1_plen_86_part_00
MDTHTVAAAAASAVRMARVAAVAAAKDAGANPDYMGRIFAWIGRRVAVRVVTFSFLCPLLEKYGTFIARCYALIEKVSSFSPSSG